jgi:hypothetical protein
LESLLSVEPSVINAVAAARPIFLSLSSKAKKLDPARHSQRPLDVDPNRYKAATEDCTKHRRPDALPERQIACKKANEQRNNPEHDYERNVRGDPAWISAFRAAKRSIRGAQRTPSHGSHPRHQQSLV